MRLNKVLLEQEPEKAKVEVQTETVDIINLIE